jgi:hypothetical protein
MKAMKNTMLAVLLLLSAVDFAAAQSLTPWKLQLPKDATYKVNVLFKSQLDQQVMGQDMKIVSDVTTVTHFRVTGVTEKGYTVEQSTKGLKMNMEMMGQSVAYDSDKKEDETSAMGERMKPLLGSTMEAVIGFDGLVTVTKALDLGDLPTTSLGAAGSDSAMLVNYFLKPPATTIAPGQSWTEEVQSGENFTKQTYTYEKTESGLASFSYILENKTVQTVTNNGMEVITKMTTKGSGLLKVELATGLVLERSFDGKLNGTSEVMGIEIAQEGIQQITTTLTRN